MKIRMSRASFVNLYRILGKHLPRKNSAQPSSIRLDCMPDGQVSFTAFSSISGVVVTCRDIEVVEAGTILFNGKVLGQTLTKLPAGDIELESREGNGRLNIGDISIGFWLLHPEDYAFPPKAQDGESLFTIGSKTLHEMFRMGSIASDPHDNFPKYLGACLLCSDGSSLKVAATDGRRLSEASRECECHGIFSHVLVDTVAVLRLLPILKRYPDCPVHATSFANWVCFSAEGFQVWAARRESQFPNYQKIIPQGPSETRLTVKTRELRNALELARICVRSGGLGLCAFGFTGDGKLYLQTSRNIDWTGRFAIPAAGSGVRGQAGFDCTFLIEALKCIDAETVDFSMNGEAGQAYIETEGFLYMLMPVRLTEHDRIDLDEIGKSAA